MSIWRFVPLALLWVVAVLGAFVGFIGIIVALAYRFGGYVFAIVFFVGMFSALVALVADGMRLNALRKSYDEGLK